MKPADENVQLAHLALNALPVTPLRRNHMIERCGGAIAALDEWRDARVTEEAVARAKRFATEELARVVRAGVRLLLAGDTAYPAQLREVPDRPVLLYCRGRLELQAPVAIVGARKPSPYGLTTAESFAARLAAGGFEIVSGLAYGIDAAAHRGALRSRGITVAVLGSGLDRLYPSAHAKLADDIVAAGGAILSELPIETGPDKRHFPQRNRIIAGLSLGTLVVEAGLRSGSLITARLAAEYNRWVWAAPGRVGSELAEGVIALLRDGATAVGKPEDIVTDLAPLLATGGGEKSLPPPGKDGIIPDTVLGAIGENGASRDELSARTGLAPDLLLSRLLQLELAGRIVAGPGGIYRRRG